MFFYVGALALSIFGAIFLPLLAGIPWWTALITAPVFVVVRIAVTERKEEKFMDIANGTVIAMFVLKILL